MSSASDKTVEKSSPSHSCDHAESSLPSSISRALVADLISSFREMLDAGLAKAMAQGNARPSAPATPGTNLNQAEKLKAADLRTALLMGKIPETAGLLVDAKILARLLDLSHSTLFRLLAEGALPEPVQLGGLKKWRLAEVLEWIEADCPPKKFWIAMKQQSARRKRR
jgi:predicted DNA-binding transcriptional regulator AlpA